MHSRITIITDSVVVIAPLDWGLGHASRCIPIVRQLLKQGNTCIIASSGAALQLLKAEFPQLAAEHIPSYNIRYKRSPSATFLSLIGQVFSAFAVRKREHIALQHIVDNYKAAFIISDNRYGAYSPHCHSIFITHQIRIRLPRLIRWAEYAVYRIHRKLISCFNECWIPDYEHEPNLTGILSHSWRVPNSYFIAPLTSKKIVPTLQKFRIVAILSGAEPQRTILEHTLIPILTRLSVSAIVVQGILEETISTRNLHNITIQNYATQAQLQELLSGATLVIARSGYSSIMDFEHFTAHFVLIPTPGQTEQEYLALHASQAKKYTALSQKNLEKQGEQVIRTILANKVKQSRKSS